MTQVGARVSAADRARASVVEGPGVGRPARVLDVQLSARGERLTVATVARRHHAVEHVNAARDALYQVFRRTDAHQVARRCRRHLWRDPLDHLVHHFLLFADAQSPDGVAVEADFDRSRKALAPQVKVRRALHDAEDRLTTVQAVAAHPRLIVVAVRVRRPARVRVFYITCVRAFALQLVEARARATRPARGQLHRGARRVVRGLAGRALVERHHDVGAERGLHLHRDFGREEAETTVNVRAKLDALFRDASQVAQTKNLKAAGVGQYRATPADEFVQTAARAYHFHAGAQPEVVRVAEYDACVEVCRLQLLEANALDRAERADGHEDGSLERAAPRLDDACARLALARERPPQERVSHYGALPHVECRTSSCVDSIERAVEKTSCDQRAPAAAMSQVRTACGSGRVFVCETDTRPLPQ